MRKVLMGWLEISAKIPIRNEFSYEGTEIIANNEQ